MSTGFNFIMQNSSATMVFLNIDKDNNNCLDVEFITPNPFLGQQYLIAPGGSVQARLFRKDGHGCDGHQGVFQASPTFIVDNHEVKCAFQQFSFDFERRHWRGGNPAQLRQHAGSGRRR